MNSKALAEAGWKTVVQKFKVQDDGLQKALAAHAKLEETAFEERLKSLGKIAALALALKKSKDITSLPVVVKYLADLIAATEAEKRDIATAKAAAEKLKTKVTQATQDVTQNKQRVATKAVEDLDKYIRQ